VSGSGGMKDVMVVDVVLSFFVLCASCVLCVETDELYPHESKR
jgi:hypothetical protein